MSFAEIAVQLDRVVELAERALQSLRQASDNADDCTKLVAKSTAGTTQESEASVVIANFDAVRSGALEQCEVLAAALNGVEQVRAEFQVGPAAAASRPAATPASRVERSWAEQQRARLPTHKTSGIYADPDGHSELVQSGREPDGEHERINAHLVKQGVLRTNMNAEATKHVEMKVAWRMRQGGVDHVEVVVNNVLCGGRLSCRVLLPHVLLPGQTLVIHDPVRSHEIRGKDDR